MWYQEIMRPNLLVEAILKLLWVECSAAAQIQNSLHLVGVNSRQKLFRFTFSSSSFLTQGTACQRRSAGHWWQWLPGTGLRSIKSEISESPRNSSHLVFHQGQISLLCDEAQRCSQVPGLNLPATESDDKQVPSLSQASAAHTFPGVMLRQSSDQALETQNSKMGSRSSYRHTWVSLALSSNLHAF